MKAVIVGILMASKVMAAEVQVGGSAQLQSSQPGTQVAGSVWLSHEGQLKVIWDGVSLNAGKVAVSTGDRPTVRSVDLPVLILDLQELLGKDWMKSIQLQVNSGTYDNDPLRGTTDTQMGRISVALTQSLHSDSSWSWSVTETASGTVHFKREFHESGAVFEAVPVTLALDTQVVRRLSQNVALSLAMGAYGSVIKCLTGGTFAQEGISASAGIDLGQALSVGLRVDSSEVAPLGEEGARKLVLNSTGFVRYVLSNSGSMNQAIGVQVGSIHDEVLTERDGSPRNGGQASVQYVVRF